MRRTDTTLDLSPSGREAMPDICLFSDHPTVDALTVHRNADVGPRLPSALAFELSSRKERRAAWLSVVWFWDKTQNINRQRFPLPISNRPQLRR